MKNRQFWILWVFKILYETKYDQQIIAGDPVLHPAVAVEELGGGQDPRSHDGSRHWCSAGNHPEHLKWSWSFF